MAVDPSRLETIPVFASLSDDERAQVAVVTHERTADAGRHLTTEGGGGYFFFVIEEGNATVTRDGHPIAELAQGDFFGEASILATTRRTATVTANSPMRLLEIFGADFAKLTGELPQLDAQIKAVLEAHLPH